MDIYCPVAGCGEPWENDTLHERAKETGSTYQQVARAFRREGCLALGTTHNTNADEPTDPTYGLRPSEAAAAMYDLLGDDMDGAAAMLEDLGF